MLDIKNLGKKLISPVVITETLKTANKLLKIDVAAKRCSYLKEENMSIVSKTVCGVVSLIPKEISEIAPGGNNLRYGDLVKDLALNQLNSEPILPLVITIPTTVYGGILETSLMSDYETLSKFIENCSNTACTNEQRQELLKTTNDQDVKTALMPEAILGPILQVATPIVTSFSLSRVINIATVSAVALSTIPATLLIPGVVPTLISSSLIGATLSTPLVIATLAEAVFQVGALSILTDLVDQTAKEVNAMRKQLFEEITTNGEHDNCPTSHDNFEFVDPAESITCSGCCDHSN